MDAVRSNDGVGVQLSYDEALVLSDLLHRWERTEALGNPALFEDKSERVILWDLTASLEPVIDELFSPTYSEAIQEARLAVRGGD